VIEQIIAGAILGAIGGLIGGVFGGSAAGYFSPLGAILGQDGRVAISKCGSQNGRRIGAFCGFLAGVTTAILVEFFQPLILILTAGAIFGNRACWGSYWRSRARGGRRVYRCLRFDEFFSAIDVGFWPISV
jgi:hypothetical protein